MGGQTCFLPWTPSNLGTPLPPSYCRHVVNSRRATEKQEKFNVCQYNNIKDFISERKMYFKNSALRKKRWKLTKWFHIFALLQRFQERLLTLKWSSNKFATSEETRWISLVVFVHTVAGAGLGGKQRGAGVCREGLWGRIGCWLDVCMCGTGEGKISQISSGAGRV